jgi:bifunctional non-homologous end joining protein LigD
LLVLVIMAARFTPQLATLVKAPPEGDAWIHEVKLDGYRLLAVRERGKVRLFTRNGNDWTSTFPRIAEALAELRCERCVLDGEAVVLDERGLSSFQELQNALGEGRRDLVLFAFDLLALDDEDLRALPLLARKEKLRALLEAAPAAVHRTLRYGDHVVGRGEDFFREACKLGLEGIVSKRADAPYRGVRTRDWLKVKCVQRQEMVVVGYTDPKGARVGLGALVVAVHDAGGRLVYAGKVGTGLGFTTAHLEQLRKRLQATERDDPPLSDPPPRGIGKVHWVEPKMVVEVAFTEWTKDGVVRHPSYQGERTDKRPEEVVRELPRAPPRTVGRRARAGPPIVAGIRLTNPDRVFYPEDGITKLELARHYETVAERMLPLAVRRPLTLLRCPEGYDQSCFFQKILEDGVAEVIPRVRVKETAGEVKDYLMIDALPALVMLVQLGVLEIHVWGSRADKLEQPDILVLDIDPGPGVSWARVVRAAQKLKLVVETLGLVPFLRVTGGKGLHVVVPIVRGPDWDGARDFTLAIARALAIAEPREFTASMAKRARPGKIFIDYVRNTRNSTAIASYSTRSERGAPVALPIDWDELDPRASGPPSFLLRDVPARLELRDPWIGFAGARRAVTKAMKRALRVS